MKNTYDVIIIGSGIVGSLAARYLSRYELSILVIEKEIDVGMCPSSANSAIIHAGYDPKPGTLKAEMNSKGSRLWGPLAQELGIVYKKTGSLVVSFGPEDDKKLKELYERGIANNIPQMRFLNKEELLKQEPLINNEARGALFAGSAAVLDPFGAVLAAAENAVSNGVEYMFETAFEDFVIEGGRITGIKTDKGVFSCRWAVNCAGLFSDEVSHKAGVRTDFSIIPRKGGYIVFDPMKIKVSNVIFPLPTEKGKGTLVSTTTHGNTLAGPDNEPASDKEDTSIQPQTIQHLLENAKKLVPSLDSTGIIAMYSGIRASGNGSRDFIIEIPDSVKGFINLCGIESPGFASAPAIALKVVELLKSSGETLPEKSGWNPVRKPFPHFHMMSNSEKAELVKKNPAYGRIVCRCEEVTEGEVLDAIHSPVPARTYDGIKRRTWLGTGRCQGAFDYPRVIEILAKELRIPVEEVSKKGKGSEFIFRKTKEL